MGETKNYMTKTKAMEQMIEYARYVLNPSFARKIAKAFGYTLKDLGLKSKKTKDHYRLNYSEETANLQSISAHRLAEEIAYKEGSGRISSMMHGTGSYAQDITEKSVEYLKSIK